MLTRNLESWAEPEIVHLVLCPEKAVSLISSLLLVDFCHWKIAFLKSPNLNTHYPVHLERLHIALKSGGFGIIVLMFENCLPSH